MFVLCIASNYDSAMGALNNTETFNNPKKIVEGWYWALRSGELKKGKAKPLNFLGKELVIFRTEGGQVVAMDAYCPHMGAHLAEGQVEGESIRCLFHHWKFSADGNCTDIPCQKSSAGVKRQRVWPAEEKYGLIWIWTGLAPRCPIPDAPELEGKPHDYWLGSRFQKNCHPNVMMINAIDSQHFNSVHRMPIPLELEAKAVHENRIAFDNVTKMPKNSGLLRFLARFYLERITYDLCYWFGSTGSVTLGPDFLHFYIIFALRPTAEGKSEGQTILVTARRSGFFGKLVNRALLFLTAVVGNYFAKGDTIIFKTIRFDFGTPIKADHAIIRFIQHVEAQSTVAWGTWLASSISGVEKQTEPHPRDRATTPAEIFN